MSECPIVLDTNTIVSAINFPNSISKKAFEKAMTDCQNVASYDTWNELETVISRPKFDKYLPLNARLLLVNALKKQTHFYDITETITDCRDPKDNKFLELAVAAHADYIITGDLDLLILNPFRTISILKSGDFLNLEIV